MKILKLLLMLLMPTRAALLLAAPLLVACAATRPATSAAQTPADTSGTATRPNTGGAPVIPAEDLTRYRPVLPPVAAGSTAVAVPQLRPVPPRPAVAAPTPTNQVNAQVEQRLRDQAYTNASVKYTDGFRVRAYLGLERDKVMAIRREIISRYPDETDYITFKQPVYRLYIGDYTTRLEAAQGLTRVRQFAPRAELEAMQVLVNKNP